MPAPATAPAAKSGDALEGLAAVYSDKLNGHKTASGQVLQPEQAHRRASVAALRHRSQGDEHEEQQVGRRAPSTIAVRRRAGRVIDLTSAAAGKIGIGKKAMAPVKLDVVKEAAAKK